jgi:Domain of unknown function DUF29
MAMCQRRDKDMATYEDDFYRWTQEQADLLGHYKGDAIDWIRLAEEIEDLGNEVRHAVESHLRNLLMHLLKWAYQPDRRGGSWRSSIRNARIEINTRLARSPSLRYGFEHTLATAYEYARALASDETDLPLDRFPDDCPWPMDDVLREEFWPEVME